LPPAQATIATPDPSGSTRFTTSGLSIRDRDGRSLILRGANVTGAEYTPTGAALPFDSGDFDVVRATGATVVRIPISWALIQPSPGSIDPAALARVRELVGWASDAGLLVVLDMHQWNWATCFGGLGVPLWAVPNCPATPPSNTAEQFAEISEAQTWFWQHPELQAALVETWGAVADALGQPDNLVGYDLFNEPGIAQIPPLVFERQYLVPFYRTVAARLRGADPGGLLFVEPAVINNVVNGSSQTLEPLGFDGVVYAPHQYGLTALNPTASGDAYDVAGPSQFAADLAIDRAVAEHMGAALWIGEWGAVSESASYRPLDYINDDLAAQDDAMIGSAYWAYSRSGGHFTRPEAAVLTRITPAAIAGTPTAFSTGGGHLSLSWTSDGGTTVVSTPAGCEPLVEVTSGAATSSVRTGGWLDLDVLAGTAVAVDIRCA
jgi:aryl-phospho-beta-D-glucosidase BglC (GH1 family)